MGRGRRGKRTTAAVAAVLAAVLAGCGGHEAIVHPPTPEMRQGFGEIGLVARPSGRPIGYLAGASVIGASAGADYGAGKAVEGCFEFWLEAARDPFSVIGAVMFAVGCSAVAAPVGAVAGSTRARSLDEVVEAKNNIERVLGAVTPRAFRDHLVSAMRVRTDRRVRVVGTANALSPEEPRLRGIDSLLWLDVAGTFSATGGEIDPDVGFVLSATAALVRRADGRLLYERSWQYQGPERTHFSFAENGGETLRSDVDRGFRMLAERIVFDLFVNTEPERIVWRAQDENSVRTLAARADQPPAGPVTRSASPGVVPEVERPPDQARPTPGPGAARRDIEGARRDPAALRLAEDLRSKAQKGDPGVQFKLALLLGPSSDEGAVWLCRAADRGHARARFLVGSRYETGARPFFASPIRAYAWYGLAARSGDDQAAGSKDRLAAELTTGQRVDAVRLLADWKAGRCEADVRGFAPAGRIHAPPGGPATP